MNMEDLKREITDIEKDLEENRIKISESFEPSRLSPQINRRTGYGTGVLPKYDSTPKFSISRDKKPT